MRDFDIKLANLNVLLSEDERLASKLNIYSSEIDDVRRNLRIKISSSAQISSKLLSYAQATKKEYSIFMKYNSAGKKAREKYIEAEKRILNRSTSFANMDSLLRFHEIERKDTNIGNAINPAAEFWDNFVTRIGDDIYGYSRDTILEAIGPFMTRTGGLITVITSRGRGVGENAFVIVNPRTEKLASSFIKPGQVLSVGAKYGLPIIGMAVDVHSMMNEGKQWKEALIKGTAHMGIGLAAGAAGAAVSAKVGAATGAFIGSVFPGAGTAAGAAVGAAVGGIAGFATGFGLSIAGDAAFDTAYDVIETNVTEKTTSTNARTVNSNSISRAHENVTCCTYATQLGTAFG